MATGQTAAMLEWLSATTEDGSHDKNGGQVGSRQIGRSENGSE
jgi:hypothetical protein